MTKWKKNHGRKEETKKKQQINEKNKIIKILFWMLNMMNKYLSKRKTEINLLNNNQTNLWITKPNQTKPKKKFKKIKL